MDDSPLLMMIFEMYLWMKKQKVQNETKLAFFQHMMLMIFDAWVPGMHKLN